MLFLSNSSGFRKGLPKSSPLHFFDSLSTRIPQFEGRGFLLQGNHAIKELKMVEECLK
jgi:hypothetical protein